MGLRPGLRLDTTEPVPLVVYPEPSITRARALDTLRRRPLTSGPAAALWRLIRSHPWMSPTLRRALTR
ncbi:hypothetical protein H4W33_010838 [Kibdelosporangium phytohabitans]|nr:hypothetical protein [Kibdelosporangium phytohabitans]